MPCSCGDPHCEKKRTRAPSGLKTRSTSTTEHHQKKKRSNEKKHRSKSRTHNNNKRHHHKNKALSRPPSTSTPLLLKPGDETRSSGAEPDENDQEPAKKPTLNLKTAIFSKAGVYTFRVPSRTKVLTIETVGGGGGGSAGTTGTPGSAGTTEGGGPGGGSGAYMWLEVTGSLLERLRNGCPLQVHVGDGGAGGLHSDLKEGQPGELSGITGLVVAGGGFGGMESGGAGGVYSFVSTCGTPSVWKQLGVGGQRGAAGAGMAGGQGGSTPIICGPGGAGGVVSPLSTSSAIHGAGGMQAGGGGGGGSGGGNGGAGAPGLVRITY